MSEIRKFHVKLGECARVKKGFLFLGPAAEIYYTGMPDKEVYSVAITSHIMYNSFAYHLYVPAGQKVFQAADGRVEVQEVTPEYILFNYIS